LVSVLAVAQAADLAKQECELVRELHPRLAREARGDGRVVRGGVAERLRGEDATGLERHVAPLLQLVQHGGVALRPRDDDDVLVVLGGGSQDRRAPDVDLIEEHASALPRRGVFGERIEVDDDEIDGLDALALELLTMCRIVAAREERGVDLRMECLHAPAEKRGLARHILDRARRYALGGERGTSSVGGDELPPEGLPSARERIETCAIRDREEGSQRG